MTDEDIIDSVVKQLKIELGADLLGVLSTGSRHRGEGQKSSDIDLPVLIASKRRQRRNRLVEGVEVEMFLNDPSQYRRYLTEDREDGTGANQHMFVTGRIVFDPAGAVADLRAEAIRQWNAGPPPLMSADIWRLRYGAADALRDIEDVLDVDPDRATYLMGALLPWLVEKHHRIKGRWRPKPKRALKDLAAWDKVASGLAERILGGDIDAMRRLAEHVMAPLGGLMPVEWQTEWEDVSDKS